MVFSAAEMAELDNVMKATAEGVKKGKKPSLSAVLMSLAGAALIMLFSLTGAGIYVSRGH